MVHHNIQLYMSAFSANNLQNRMLSNNFILNFLKIVLLLTSCICQKSIILYPNSLASDQTPITIYNSSNNPQQNQTFVQRSKTFNCSLSPLYSYLQNQRQFLQNQPYQIQIAGIQPTFQNSTQFSVSISTIHSLISPTINGTNQIICQFSQCNLLIQNGCNLNLNKQNYFDVIILNISTFNYIIQYYVVCNTQYQGNSFQYGLLIQIIFCTIAITITAVYSNAWSVSGRGIKINIFVILIFNGVFIIGGVVSIFNFYIVQIAVDVISWIFGFFGVWLSANQILFLFKNSAFLRKQIFKTSHSRFGDFTLRTMDIISVVIGVGFCCGWWFSNKNWIVNDVIATCLIISAIKIFKFTSLKQAILCFVITIIVQIIFVLLIAVTIQKSYDNLILNIFNNPFELQLPTINAVYNQKCAWLPITSIIYPGALMSYMRRFDTSRNTKVYIITCASIFFIGSLIWMFVSIATSQILPYGMIAQPATLGFISMFAWKRKQIRTLWSGKFYDEQFANKESLRTISQSISKQRRNTQIKYNPDMFTGLEFKQEESHTQRSQIVKQIQMVQIGQSPMMQQIKQVSNSANSSLSASNSYTNNQNQSSVSGMLNQQVYKTLSMSSEGKSSQKQLLDNQKESIITQSFPLQQNSKQIKTSLFNKKDRKGIKDDQSDQI